MSKTPLIPADGSHIHRFIGRGAIWLTLIAFTGYSDQVSSAVYATFESGRDAIVLMTDKCPSDKTGELKWAFSKSSGSLREGCYVINSRGNPVVSWGGGTIQELDAAMFRIDPKQAIIIQEIHIDPSPETSAVSEYFKKPSWCKNARLPHEKEICSNALLSKNDLDINELYAEYKDLVDLTAEQLQQHKNQFFISLKSCKSSIECISNKQKLRVRYYQDEIKRLRSAQVEINGTHKK